MFDRFRYLADGISLDAAEIPARPIYPVITCPEQQKLLSLWKARRAGRPLPALTDFCAADLAVFADRLTLLKVLDGGADFFYQSHSETLTAQTGVDMTNRRMSDWCEEVRVHAQLLFPGVAQNAMPYFLAHPPLVLRGRQHLTRIALPLAGDHIKPDHLWVLHSLEAGEVPGPVLQPLIIRSEETCAKRCHSPLPCCVR